LSDAQQGADPKVEAGEPDRSTAPEPDTIAQQAADPAAEAGSEPEAGAEAEAAAEPEAATKAEAEEAAGEAEEPAGEAEGAEQAEAAAAEAGEGEAEGAEEQVVLERADEEPEEPPAEERDPAAAAAAELAAARAEAESHLDDLRRLQADFDNYRKRMLREQTARVASASQALVARLLPVLDNFELAVSHAEQSRDFDRMLKGVEMVFGELREVLQAEGLVKIEAEGKPFDPERHEAVVAVEQEGAEPGTVVDVVRTGYELRGKVLRPAMVKVAK
jgi:molecular chaperone GrpE